MNDFLAQLFKAHGIEAVLEGEGVVFPGRLMRAGAAIVGDHTPPGHLSVQFDVWLEIGLARTVLESFAGFGATRDEAISCSAAKKPRALRMKEDRPSSRAWKESRRKRKPRRCRDRKIPKWRERTRKAYR